MSTVLDQQTLEHWEEVLSNKQIKFERIDADRLVANLEKRDGDGFTNMRLELIKTGEVIDAYLRSPLLSKNLHSKDTKELIEKFIVYQYTFFL